MSNNEIQPNFLFENIKNLIKESQNSIITAISNTMSLTYFEIGRMIVEEEQKGELRANYGKQIIKTLSS
jgi:site-specific DNA-cytosine methylase